jgi:ABC-type sugar transport system ATPase subunit
VVRSAALRGKGVKEMASVEFERVSKSYGETQVVRDLSLSVAPGEFLVLVGPSGCGKSTSLRMIAGLEELTTGNLKIDGVVVNDQPPRKRDIGMVFQSYALYPHMSVEENLQFALRLQKMPAPEIRSRVQAVAKLLGLTELLSRRPKALSGGQRQRVAIGRVIVRRPKVFLFDEPLSNLDAALRVQMRAEIAELHRTLGITMIYVTHDQVEAMTLADRIAVMHHGVLQQVAPPLELYERPANQFVAGFIGSPAMNFLEGELARSGADCVVKLPYGEIPVAGAEGPAGPVTLGIRPQDLSLGAHGVPGRVEVIEPMGWEAYAYVRAGDQRMVVRLAGADARKVRAGDQVAMTVDPKRAYLFGPGGETIGLPTP